MLKCLEKLRTSGPTLNLFPTENRMSAAALAALGSDLVSRYPGSEGDGYLYGDPSDVGALYAECTELTERYFGARTAFVQFLSGLHAMQSVVTTVCRPGDHVLVLDPTRGGHYATETICQDLGLSVQYVPVDAASLRIDPDSLAEVVRRHRPRLVYLDLSTVLRLPRPAELRAAVGPEPLLCLDASHLLGLLPAGLDTAELWSTVDLVSASTHKTFPGPQKAVVLTGRDEMAELIGGRLGFRVSSGHTNSVAALAVTLDELMTSRVPYGRAVVANARAFAAALAEHGHEVAGRSFGHTETHQVWIAPPPELDPTDWGRRLTSAGIRSTVVNLPAYGRSGLRLGVQELTRVGMGPADMVTVADLVDIALRQGTGSSAPPGLREKVATFATGFPDVRVSFS